MWGKKFKQTLEIPYTLALPEQYGGDEADCVLFITGEFTPGCPATRIDPPEYDMFEFHDVKARTEECYGTPSVMLDVWEQVNNLSHSASELLQEACLDGIGLYNERDYEPECD